MSMMRFLALALSLAAASWTSAFACSPEPFIEWETGRRFAHYYPPKATSNDPILEDALSLAIIRTELIKQVDAEYGDYQENILRHIILETITPGAISLNDRGYPDDPTIQETYLKPNFHIWEKARINTPETTLGTPIDSCGGTYPQLALKPEGLYLAFMTRNKDRTSRIVRAAPIKTPNDEIVLDYKKIASNAAGAPHRMTPEAYFKNMSDFIELDVLECPKSEDFGYTDSRFGTDDKQVDVLYSLGERTREPRRPFDLRDAFSYVQQVSGQSSYVNLNKIDCAFGDRYLYLAGHGAKYLKIENGLIDTSKIGTRIEITGNHLVRAAQVKEWIRESKDE